MGHRTPSGVAKGGGLLGFLNLEGHHTSSGVKEGVGFLNLVGHRTSSGVAKRARGGGPPRVSPFSGDTIL